MRSHEEIVAAFDEMLEHKSESHCDDKYHQGYYDAIKWVLGDIK